MKARALGAIYICKNPGMCTSKLLPLGPRIFFFKLWFSVFFQIFSIKHVSILEIEQNTVTVTNLGLRIGQTYH